MKFFLLLVLLTIKIIMIKSTDYVPVIMWDNVKNTVRVPTLNTLSMTQFMDVLKKKYAVDQNLSVLIFGENSLNLEDLTYQPNDEDLFSGMMKQLVNNDGLQLNFLLQVENPILASTQFDLPTTIALNDDMIKPARPGEITIMNFDEAEYNNRREMLHDHIQRMEKLYKKWRQGASSMLVFISGHRSRRLVDEEDAKIKKRKSARSRKKGIIMETSEVYLYLEEEAQFIKRDESNETLIKCNPPDKTEENDTKTVHFKFCGSQSEIILNFIKHPGGYWQMLTVNFSIPGESRSWAVPTRVSAPNGYSYHCTNLVVKNRYNDRIVLKGLQVQPFYELKKGIFKFGPATDCCGVLTKAIVAGIMVISLMCIVLTYGVMMISNINTNDRFENPKGYRLPIVEH